MIVDGDLDICRVEGNEIDNERPFLILITAIFADLAVETQRVALIVGRHTGYSEEGKMGIDVLSLYPHRITIVVTGRSPKRDNMVHIDSK